MTSGRFTALVLAGSRRGAEDPVAKAAGVTHKSLVEIAGRPMLQRVVDALQGSSSVGRIVLAIENRRLLDKLPALSAALAQGRIDVIATDNSPATTVLAALRQPVCSLPLLVTTSDHALLTAQLVDRFCAEVPADIDVAAGLCSRRTIEAAFPGSRRTYIRLGGEGYSGCNLFALMTPRASAAIAFWTRMERHRKKPWRYASEIGLAPLAAYLTGRLTLEAAFARLSLISGARGAPVLLASAEAAIDVDTPEDLEQVRAIARASAG